MLKKELLFYVFWFLIIVSLLYGVVLFDFRIMFISSFTIVLFLVLYILEKTKKFRIVFGLKLLIYLFLFCSLILGEVFNFYTNVYYWDILLHLIGGVITSYLGLLLFKKYVNFVNKYIFIFCFLFSFCFSITLGVMWEFVEYSFDKYLGCDMQKDTYLTHFSTVNLDNSDIYYIDDIVKTEIYTKNGVILLDKAYLDVGLVDTISDLFAGVCSAFVVSMVGSYLLFLKKGLN